MGYYSDLRVAITKKDYLSMIEKNKEDSNICDYILDPNSSYIKEYSENGVNCILIQQFDLKYYKEFEDVQTFEKYLSQAKSGYVFFRIGSSWNDIEYRNTAKYEQLEKPFTFINKIRKETIENINLEKVDFKKTSKEYIITDVKEIINYCKGNDDIIKSIKRNFEKGTQFKIILDVDVTKDETRTALYYRHPQDEDYNILSAETIDMNKTLEFLGYPNKEKFLEDINKSEVEDEEEFE